MAIDFTLSPELEEIRPRVRTFIDDVVRPAEQKIDDERLPETDRKAYIGELLRHARAGRARPASGCRTCPRSGAAWGSATSSWRWCRPRRRRPSYGPWVLNCQAPDEGNMHTLLHWGTDEQKEKYLRPLCDGTA